MSMTRIMEWYIKKLANSKNELVHLFLIVQLQFFCGFISILEYLIRFDKIQFLI